jgi:hypothetical protein
MKGQAMTIYQHIRHPRIAARRADRPVKVADLFRRDSAVNRFNTKVAIVITAVVGSMWCAYAFALFDLISLPTAIRTGPAAVVTWVARTFLQLVLLSIIMVGQNVQAAAADQRAEATPDADDQATLPQRPGGAYVCLGISGSPVKAARSSRAAFVSGWSAPSTRSQSATVSSSSKIASAVRPAARYPIARLIRDLRVFWWSAPIIHCQ